ncbi:uncharacterized protein YjiS (DUF1127 family)|uniref:DUF1127 domain-containing protein n=1 Tax=Brenneria salicis TaxID=55214 RepID=UPI000DE8EE5D|nr:DUF1127 domain-containing protein [Brenneria salicis]NMN93374.1 uncharacterized protein YjiS (DUF1127 family) [Brenneria salicis ATCC 15712 = DSM 30166]
MGFHQQRLQQPCSRSRFRRMITLPYRRWKAWRVRNQTRKILQNMNDDRLRDIGLTRDDIDRF